MFTLIDDGTLDTVVRCDSCGEEMRYNYSEDFNFEEYDYDQFLSWALETAAEDHECGGE